METAVSSVGGSLLERERELKQVHAALSDAIGGAGRVVLIEGPAGIGKSRLLAAAAELAEGSGLAVLSASASELEREHTFGVVLQLLAPVMDPGDDDLFAGAAAMSRGLFAADPDSGQWSGGDATFPLLHGLQQLIATLAERRPIALAVDDSHWCDEPSLALLGYVARRIGELPIALLITRRTGEPATGRTEALLGDLRERNPYALIRPAPLSPRAAGIQVRRQIPDAADEFCDACAVVSAGVPFYLRELLAAARAEGVPATADGAARLQRLMPESVEDSVTARLRRLAPEAEAVARAAAVLGAGATIRQAAAMAELDPGSAGGAADALVEAEILSPGEPLGFAHPLVESAVLAGIPPARLGRLRHEAARLLADSGAAPERVAAQLLDAERCEEEWSCEVLVQAASRARSRGAPGAAVRYLERALEEPPPPAGRGEVLADLGLARAEAGNEGGADTLAEAIGSIADPRRRAAAFLDLSTVLLQQGRFPRAAEAARRGLEELGDADPAMAADLEVARSNCETWVDLTDLAATRRRIAKAQDSGSETSPGGRWTLANAAIACTFAGAPADEIGRLARRAVAVGEPSPHPFDASAFPVAGFSLLLAGDPHGAERAAAAALSAAERHGSVLELGAAVHVRAAARYQLGRLADSLADAETAVETGRWGWGATLPVAHAHLVRVCVELDRLDDAERAMRMPGGEARWAVNNTYGALLLAHGELLLARGEPDAALERIELAGRLAEMVHARNPAAAPWRSLASRALIALGEGGRARALAAEEVELARAYDAPAPTAGALRALGVVEEEEERGIARLRESVGLLSDSPFRLELARSLVELGSALRRAGRKREAREVLRQGLDRADRCEATPLADSAREELRVAGARPRRPAVSGVGALTPSERRVADLAADGLRNREIAQRLYVTRRTVEMHLTAAYGKLGISSREDLPTALAADEDRGPARESRAV